MAAFIRDGRGRVINPRAGLAEVQAALQPGVKVSAVLMSGKGRFIQGRLASVEGGKITLDNEVETVSIGDVIAIKLDDEGANNDRKTKTK